MIVSWTTGPFSLLYESDYIGFRLRSSFASDQAAEVRWHEVVGAGLVKAPGRGRRLPDTGTLDELRSIGYTTQTVILAIAQGEARKAVYMRIPREGPERELILADLREHLDDVWIEEELGQFELRRRLELANWWIVPSTCGVMLLIGVIVMLVFIGLAGAESIVESVATEWKIVLLGLFGIAVAVYARKRFTR